MWLIKTDTLQLQLVPDSKGYRYGILSHTWEEEEVSFQQIQNIDSARHRKGFEKIDKTCELARQMGLEYAWIDTCCIDKTNNVELSEAINSMFKWYRDSSICFVYLSDLPPAQSDTASPATICVLNELVGECRWFTRGWTLQELIAPLEVNFIDQTWQRRGSKNENLEILSRITGIETQVLESAGQLWQTPVARKMAWSANRQTTRPEDLAYCLLGLFDITMPLLYGEGTKAFLRLQEEIAKETNDLSLFAWRFGENSQSLSAYSGIFAVSPRDFAGCGKIKPVRQTARLDREYTITNKGISMEPVLTITETNDFVLPLECYDGNAQTSESGDWLGIYLTLSTSGYLRRQPDRFYYSNNLNSGEASTKSARIYIQKTFHANNKITNPSQIMRRFGIERSLLHPRGPYHVMSAGPDAFWDSSKGQFIDGLEFPVTLYLHVRYDIPGTQKTVDFAIIISVEGPLSWSYLVRHQANTVWQDLLAAMNPSFKTSHDDTAISVWRTLASAKLGSATSRMRHVKIFKLHDTSWQLIIYPPHPASLNATFNLELSEIQNEERRLILPTKLLGFSS